MMPEAEEKDRRRDPGRELPGTKGSSGEDGGRADPPTGADLLDDLLRELSDESLAASESGTAPPTASEGGRPRAPGGTAGAAAGPRAGPPGGTREVEATEEPLGLEELQRSLDLARAESSALKAALGRQQTLETELRRELSDLRGAQRHLREQLEKAAARFLPAAPVAFLSADGKMIVKKAFYALGRGEALEGFVAALLAGWQSGGGRIMGRYDRDGFTVSLEGDPYQRSLRLMPSGIYLVRLSPAELAKLGDLPPLVRLHASAAPRPRGHGNEGGAGEA